ncbi:MAG: tetratricopeptide repeat protein, partial [Pirellulales bacterium]
MSGTHRIRLRRILREAEGYLELGMANHALGTLDRAREPGTFASQVLYLRGEALRELECYAEAIDPLARSAELAPSNTHIQLALGWCYKRTGRLDMAIDALEHARDVEPTNALIQYNLACYWSLAGNRTKAVGYLTRAVAIDARYRELAGDESD